VSYWSYITRIRNEEVSRSLRKINKAKHCKMIQNVYKAQHPPLLPDKKKIDVSPTKCLRALKANELPKVLTADKNNAKIAALLRTQPTGS
jgi:predicted transcriptional regulator